MALLWFSHGVMVAWTSPPLLGLALLQVGLCTGLVLAASWDGMRARFALSSRLMPTAETTSPSGKRRRISRAMTWLLSSAVQKRCAAVLHGKISFTHSRFA